MSIWKKLSLKFIAERLEKGPEAKVTLPEAMARLRVAYDALVALVGEDTKEFNSGMALAVARKIFKHQNSSAKAVLNAVHALEMRAEEVKG